MERGNPLKVMELQRIGLRATLQVFGTLGFRLELAVGFEPTT